jgi:hypothetical protein
LTIADIGFGRLLVSAWGRLDSVIGYVNWVLIQAGGSVCLEKILDDTFGLAIVALSEVVIPNASIPVDEIICRPVFIVERIPNPMIAVDGNRIGNVQITHSVLYVRPLV